MLGDERLGKQSSRLRVESGLVLIRTKQHAIEQKQPAQEDEQNRANEARKQAESQPHARIPIVRLTTVRRPATVCHAHA